MRRSFVWFSCLVLAATLVTPAAGALEDPPPFDYGTPVFGLNPQEESGLLVADAGKGVVGLGATAELLAEVPGASDAVAVEGGDIMVVSGGPPDAGIPGGMTLYRVSGDQVEPVADLWEFEQAENPDAVIPEIGPDNVDSNPYDLARLDGATLVADAGGNDLLHVTDDGAVSVVAVFPSQLASTSHIFDLIDCENPTPEEAELCELPDELPAQAVPTSVAVGPDGSYYVGELTGFPFTPGLARIWKIAPGTTDTVCPSADCVEVFADRSFTAVVDVAFGPDGTFYVLELASDGIAGLELGLGLPTTGTLHACKPATESCAALADALFVSTATTVGDHGTVYATTGALVPGQAAVIAIGKEFTDDNGSVHELDIAVLAALGITAGCNPPDNDAFCPEDETTRGEMAAFLRRALALPASAVDAFGDDDGSVFEGDINALAAAGITRGCNPPANDQFCPDRSVSRGEMAAFLTRGLELPASADDAFADDDDSIFEAEIDALAAAGITRGCNPPANDHFCPDDFTTRAEMASFLVRAVRNR